MNIDWFKFTVWFGMFAFCGVFWYAVFSLVGVIR